MEVDSSYMEDFFSEDQSKWLGATKQIKNSVIGNSKQKTVLLDMGIVSRLAQLMLDENSSVEMLIECVVVLNSLAKTNQCSRVDDLLKCGILSLLFRGLTNTSQKYVEGCLRCLQTIFMSSAAPTDIIYQESALVPLLISLLNKSQCSQESVGTILACSCKTETQQAVLYNSGLVPGLVQLLGSNIYKVQMAALKCICQLSYKNELVSSEITSGCFEGDPVPQLLVKCLGRDKPLDMQLYSAKCLTNLYRSGALNAKDPVVCVKTLSTCVRMCKKDKSVEYRVQGAETLAYLIEVDLDLQQSASITDHLIVTLATYMRSCPPEGNSQESAEVSDLKQAVFRAFAALGANDEDIRKRIIETENLMDHIIIALNEGSYKIQLSAVRCMHSLSRSVQQLRTSFQEYAVWKPLMQMLRSAPPDILTVASSTLCNLLLEFSPSKEPILEQGAIEVLVDLTKRDDPALRLNGIWALMNMAFQTEQKIKSHILTTLGPDQLFRLLSDPDGTVLMKTLGLLRNLLSNKPTLCILANVADGDSAKDFIMTNEDVLKKLMNYMMHTSVKLQVAAVFCVNNLIWNEDDDALIRQVRLKDLGFQKLLQRLLGANDTMLFDKVKTALQQFS